MIGVLSKPVEARAAEEFFHLFKTPWEFVVPGHSYEVVISTLEDIPDDLSARALIVYQSHPTRLDERTGVAAAEKRAWVEWGEAEFPIYGDLAVLHTAQPVALHKRGTRENVGGLARSTRPVVRIGFDLFYEVGFLLSKGQPSANALLPTLEVHISLVRAILASLGVSFVEVPPAPAGYDCLACLTHDVDFVGIRDHKCDHTMWGFLYRSLIGSLIHAIRGDDSWAKCRRNWAAALSLPLVHVGLLKDWWLEFDRYAEMERKFGSTFFFIPFRNVAGTVNGVRAPYRRAAKYDVARLRNEVGRLLKKGCEIGLHGIDAWQDAQSGSVEMRRIRELTGQDRMGTRIHWLYWSEDTPKAIEEAGFSYDSTFGYNEAVGFRAGTSQPFCPLSAERILELPLNIQDSALFFSDHMRLSEAEALNVCKAVIECVASSGGAVVVNWHTRSLSPERLWGDAYAQLLEEIQGHRVWFGTAQQVVDWFRKRRALRFESVGSRDGGTRIAVTSPDGGSDPAFTVRVHHPVPLSGRPDFALRASAFTDYRWDGGKAWEAVRCAPDYEHAGPPGSIAASATAIPPFDAVE